MLLLHYLHSVSSCSCSGPVECNNVGAFHTSAQMQPTAQPAYPDPPPLHSPCLLRPCVCWCCLACRCHRAALSPSPSSTSSSSSSSWPCCSCTNCLNYAKYARHQTKSTIHSHTPFTAAAPHLPHATAPAVHKHLALSPRSPHAKRMPIQRQAVSSRVAGEVSKTEQGLDSRRSGGKSGGSAPQHELSEANMLPSTGQSEAPLSTHIDDSNNKNSSSSNSNIGNNSNTFKFIFKLMKLAYSHLSPSLALFVCACACKEQLDKFAAWAAGLPGSCGAVPVRVPHFEVVKGIDGQAGHAMLRDLDRALSNQPSPQTAPRLHHTPSLHPV